VIHFAAYYHYGDDWRKEYGSTNINGTINIIEAAHWAGVKRIIFASSTASPACSSKF
jgi:nucleoside-diphosphate-sugar epimerase